MSARFDIRIFAHSWISDWNHGNAHFLRGLASALLSLGHRVRCYEPFRAWSVANLVAREGERAVESLEGFRRHYPELNPHFYDGDTALTDFMREELRGADVVIIHEWNEPQVVRTILGLKRELGFRALFHDTHHRAYTAPAEILRFPLHLFDGVLAFGEALRRVYSDGFGVQRAWTFHEAADIERFAPRAQTPLNDVLWIGNWGDDERTLELREFLIAPAAALKRRFAVHGVRYPQHALAELARAGIAYRGYLPNLESPSAYGSSKLALHVPRRPYSNGLSGVPTIRVFEALACGAPLLCAPWSDSEGLFTAGQDYWVAVNGNEMTALIGTLLADDAARRQLAANGLATVRRRHTCRHRAEQLTEICEELGR